MKMEDGRPIYLSPYLSLEDAEKLDEVRKALAQEDLKRAAKLARVFELTPVRL